MEMTYKNKSRNRLKNNHKYLCDISPPSHGDYTYLVHFYYDCTIEEDVNIWLPYASEISLRNNFEFDRLEIE